MPRGRFGADVVGMRSGMVTALEKSDKVRRGCALWKCRCDCGNIFYTEGYKISGQKIQSCGCLRAKNRRKDLSGMRFGRLTAVRRLDEKRGKDNSYLWLCRCDCGAEVKASVNDLTSGGCTGCGCAKSERLRAKAKDIAGEHFGKLRAIAPTEKRADGSVVWRCICSCGKEVQVPYNSLVSGNTKSCGCLKRENPGPAARMRYIDGTCVDMLEKRTLRADNTSGVTGVLREKKSGKWRAVITFKGKTYYLGRFERLDDAARARRTAEEKIFGDFLEWYYGTKFDFRHQMDTSQDECINVVD